MKSTNTAIILFLFFMGSPSLSTPAISNIETSLMAVDKSIRLRQYSQAVRQLKPLLKQNIAEAQYRMAGLYRAGKGVKSNLDKATELYTKAAVNGLADAQYSLASILEKQDPTKHNPAETLGWYQAAADQGYRRAINKLAYLEKIGTDNDSLINDQERIFSAIRTNDLERVRSLIKAGVNLDIVDNIQQSALIVALRAKHLEMSQMLLAQSTGLDTPDSNNVRPIHIAARNGYTDIVLNLISNNVDINATDHVGNTALIIATRHEDKNMMNLLINHDADYSIKNKKFQSAPQLAQIMDLQIAKSVFLRQGIRLPEQNEGFANVDIETFQQSVNKSGSLYKGWPLLNVASLLGETEIVTQLLNRRVDMLATDATGNSAMHRAASEGKLQILSLLTSRGGNINAVNSRSETPLYLAAASGQLKAVNLLVRNGATTSIIAKNKTSALSIAIKNQHETVALALLGGKLDKVSIHRALLLAVQNKMETLSVQLINVDVYVNQADSKNRSALWYGADLGLKKTTMALIRVKRAPINLADTKGYTPLARAVSRGNLDIARLLITRGANTNTITKEKNTILMLSVLSKNNKLTIFLLTRDIDINAKEIAGETALMLAAATGQETMVISLMEAGADLLTRNLDDQNAYQIAINSGHNKTADLIEENSNTLFKLFN